MTLSPVFRSREAVRLLADAGMWSRLEDDMAAQVRAVRVVHEDLREVIGKAFLAEPPELPSGPALSSTAGLRFLQEYFFLILFRSILRSTGVSRTRLDLYTELNFCIKGTITAADNLFDDQDKSLLPLRAQAGSRFMSILQLMAFERLSRRALDRGEASGILDRSQSERIQVELFDAMAAIGRLEGSEEEGVYEITDPETMVEAVHEVRGGALFGLAFTAPRVLESGDKATQLAAAEEAASRLGTAFQIVDDLTDFEFDLRRRSHNILVAEIHHRGTSDERTALVRCMDSGTIEEGAVETIFERSARAVLRRAEAETRTSFEALKALGHWADPDLAPGVVRAIVGLDGVARMETIASTHQR